MDASKLQHGIGCALVYPSNNYYQEQFKLPNNMSIFSAEILAVKLSLQVTLRMKIYVLFL